MTRKKEHVRLLQFDRFVLVGLLSPMRVSLKSWPPTGRKLSWNFLKCSALILTNASAVLRLHLKERFGAAGITLPFPQRTVHLAQNNPPVGADNQKRQPEFVTAGTMTNGRRMMEHRDTE